MSKYPAGSQVAEGYYVFDQSYNPKPYELFDSNFNFSQITIPIDTVCKVTNVDPTGFAKVVYEFEIGGTSYVLTTNGPLISMSLEKIDFQSLSPTEKAPFITMATNKVLHHASNAASAETAAKQQLTLANEAALNSNMVAINAMEIADTPAHIASMVLEQQATAALGGGAGVTPVIANEGSNANPSIAMFTIAIRKVGSAANDILRLIDDINFYLKEASFHAKTAAEEAVAARMAMQDPAASVSMIARVHLNAAMNSAKAAAAVARNIEDRLSDANDDRGTAIRAGRKIGDILKATKERNAATAAATAYRNSAGIASNAIAASVREGLAAGTVKEWKGGKYKLRKTRRNNRNKSRRQRKNSKRH